MENIIAATFTTLITTPDYAPGVVCLAHSLMLVRSTASIECWVTSSAVEEAIAAILPPPNLHIRLLPTETVDAFFHTAADIDQSLFIDAPRRSLFKMGHPFVFLDADMICLSNIDDLFDLLRLSTTDTDTHWIPGTIYAVANFRNKKRSYGDCSGNFNAGLMVIPDPQPSDYTLMTQMLADGFKDTEEKMLNEVFRGRWRALPVAYNCQKRCFKLAPLLWNKIVSDGVRVIHYVGGKPWQSKEQLERNDWEGGEAYAPLFAVWHLIYSGSIKLSSDQATYVNSEGDIPTDLGADLCRSLVPLAEM